MSNIKIYFAASIRGGRNDVLLYKKLIQYLSTKGQILTEHVGNILMNSKGEDIKEDFEIYNRDIEWIKTADMLIAEVSNPSLGVGYELSYAENLNIPILCLYKYDSKNRLSAMINGNKFFLCKKYKNVKEALAFIDDFINI